MYDGAMLSDGLRTWLARLLVAAVFTANVQSAIAFLARPSQFAPAFELSGTVGASFVQALGVLFLMWNATYPPVMFRPTRYRAMFGVVIAQQVIGLAGESWLLSLLPAPHVTLASSIMRFIVFDALGLAALSSAFLLTRNRGQR